MTDIRPADALPEVEVPDGHGLRRSWRDSDRFVPRAFVRPALRFTQVEAAGGIVMLLAAIVALVWANSGFHSSYERFWSTPVDVRVGSILQLDLDLHGVVNDVLMTLFFLIAGLEIKRQVVTGELRDRRAATLPVLAALGGMVVPALIFLSVNHGHPGSRGWGIPVATDIAFAVGVVTLAGRRVPLGARIFILTLAVVDDVGGIVVIAVFYADQVRLGWLALAAGSVIATVAVRRAEVRSIVPYVLLGGVCWYALHSAGVEAAIAGVVFALLTPIAPFHDPARFGKVARSLIDRIEASDEIATEDLARYAKE
ncbi:MAG TPA: Na+/H+ antiporter NhaA, partial [Acidimicrobiales bacterium]